MIKPTLSFEQHPTRLLKPYAKNARRHGPRQVGLICASIEAHGFTNPVLADDDLEVIAGHGRLAAALKLGLEEIPVIRISGLTEPQKRALRIADNRIAERSSWTPDLLAGELKDLLELEIDLSLTGFDDIEIDQILSVEGPPAEDEPAFAPPPDHPVARAGDLWALGPHRLFCGDSRIAESFSALLGNTKADLVITDVPFNVPIAGHVSGLGGHTHAEFAMASGEMTVEQFRAFLLLTLGHARDASRDGSLHYVFIDWRSVADLVLVGRELFEELKNIIAWVKPNAGMGSLYRSQHEFIAVFKHGRAGHVNNVQLGRLGRNRSNVWQYPGASGFSRTRASDLQAHPTVKPIKMIEDAIRDASNPNDVVLDPFGGAGTTLLAAEQAGRRAALIEYEPRYIDVTLRRYLEKTGREPLLLPDHIPLSEVARLRAACKDDNHV